MIISCYKISVYYAPHVIIILITIAISIIINSSSSVIIIGIIK